MYDMSNRKTNMLIVDYYFKYKDCNYNWSTYNTVNLVHYIFLWIADQKSKLKKKIALKPDGTKDNNPYEGSMLVDILVKNMTLEMELFNYVLKSYEISNLKKKGEHVLYTWRAKFYSKWSK